MKIGTREIGPDYPPYIVAEVGANHGGSLSHALRLIELAKASGADAVKFQCYTADTITIDSDRPEFLLTEGPWKGRRLYDLYKQCETPFDWFPRIAEHAKHVGITWFASAFDESAVDVLDKLDCPAIKIASFELVDTPLIAYAANTGRPLILSTGMGTLQEIEQALVYAARGEAEDVAILHCVSGYPTPVEEAGLMALTVLQRIYGNEFPIGISDHTTGTEVPIAATAMGACMIEKHFKAEFGPWTADAMFSITPDSFRYMTYTVRDIWKAMNLDCPDTEAAQRPLRRSLYVVKDLAAGEAFTKENVRSIRPGAGMAPWRLADVLTRSATRAIARGTPLSDEMLG